MPFWAEAEGAFPLCGDCQNGALSLMLHERTLSGNESMYEQYAHVLIFGMIATVIVVAPIVLFALIRPVRPSSEKLSPYECGERPVGEPWVQFNIRYYVVCIIFIVFEVEVLFMLPWAVVFNAFRDGGQNLQAAAGELKNLQGATGLIVFLEMLIFLVVLAVGLAYVWAKGHLEWIRETTKGPELLD
ncbi:MAG: NAD(P)H-quinone oxidoreductase subunit 3, chloroplastic [bacterium]|nr:NAD(P)H-quinone oxidoreductase subunit 3, chloroplastic [bacterium]